MRNVIRWFIENRYLAIGGLACAIMLIVGVTAYAYHNKNSPKISYGTSSKTVSASAPDYAKGCGGPCDISGQNNVTPPTPSSTATTSTQTSTKPVTSYEPPDNSSQCNTIVASAKSDLNALNTQIAAQLIIEKSIIGNNSL